jgi:hypothetical protein
MNEPVKRPWLEPETSLAWQQRWQETVTWLRGFIYGMTYYEMERELRKERADLEHLFLLINFGDLVGVPILPPYYSIRLLPYIVPMLGNWQRRLLREKDLTDLIG